MNSKQVRSPKLSVQIWLPSVLLVILVCAAAIGVLSGSSPALMIVVSTMALGFWEIAEQVAHRWGSNNFHAEKLLKSVQGKLLFITVGIGLLLAEGGLQVHLKLPFGVVILAGLLTLIGFSRFYRLVLK